MMCMCGEGSMYSMYVGHAVSLTVLHVIDNAIVLHSNGRQ